MGRARLRGHGHPRPAGGAGRVVPRRQQQINHSDEPDAAATNAVPELLSGQHAFRVGDRECQRDAHADPQDLGIRIRQSIGDRGNERVAYAVPLTEPNRVPHDERQPKAIRLAVA